MQFFPDDWSQVFQAFFGGAISYVAILIFVRIIGLRSFAKMASHDFAVTVAIGSVLAAGSMATDTPLIIPIVSIATLFGLQWILSNMLQKSATASNVLENQPVLLMDGREILHDNLKATKVSQAELRAKLREANVTRYDQVKAVVFESTGDIAVLHGEPDLVLEDGLLDDVRRDSRNF